jgi:hypothetical protein
MRRDIPTISLHPSAVARALALVAFLLIVASIAGQLSKFLLGHGRTKGFVFLFDLNREGNIPAFFSVLLMICAAFLLGVLAILDRQRNTPNTLHWSILAGGFLCMAFDEAFAFHERLIEPICLLLGDRHLGVFYYGWVIPGITLVILIALLLMRFLLRLPSGTRFRFLLGAFPYLGGSLGVEMIGGAYEESYGRENLTYSMISTIEESLELAGLIVFIYALLAHISSSYKEVRFRFYGEGSAVWSSSRPRGQDSSLPVARGGEDRGTVKHPPTSCNKG